MPLPIVLPAIPAIMEAIGVGTAATLGIAALWDHITSDDFTSRYREEFGDQLRTAMPQSTSTEQTRPNVPYSPIREEYRYTPGDGLQALGINLPLEIASSIRTETPIYEAHPRRRTVHFDADSVVDASQSEAAASSQERTDSTPNKNNSQNNKDENKPDTTKYNFWRAPISNLARALWGGRPGQPVPNLNPTYGQTLLEWGVPIGTGAWSLLDEDDENTRTTKTDTIGTPTSAQQDSIHNYSGMHITLDSLFNL